MSLFLFFFFISPFTSYFMVILNSLIRFPSSYLFRISLRIQLSRYHEIICATFLISVTCFIILQSVDLYHIIIFLDALKHIEYISFEARAYFTGVISWKILYDVGWDFLLKRLCNFATESRSFLSCLLEMLHPFKTH